MIGWRLNSHVNEIQARGTHLTPMVCILKSNRQLLFNGNVIPESSVKWLRRVVFGMDL